MSEFKRIEVSEKALAEIRLALQKGMLNEAVLMLDELIPSLRTHEDYGKLRSARRVLAETLVKLGGDKIIDPLDPVKEVGSIHIHAWKINPVDGSQESCDPNDEGVDGWSVYTRIETPNDPQQPFDLIDDVDFETREQALAEAEERHRKTGFPIENWGL